MIRVYPNCIYRYLFVQVLYILDYTLYSDYKYMFILISPESQQDFVVNTVIKNSVLSLLPYPDMEAGYNCRGLGGVCSNAP